MCEYIVCSMDGYTVYGRCLDGYIDRCGVESIDIFVDYRMTKAKMDEHATQTFINNVIN